MEGVALRLTHMLIASIPPPKLSGQALANPWWHRSFERMVCSKEQ